MKNTIYRIAAIAVLALCAFLAWKRYKSVMAERDLLRSNQETILRDYDIKVKEANLYKVRDSLSAVKIGAMQLTLDEYKALNSDSYSIIKELKGRNGDLESAVEASMMNEKVIHTYIRDTVLIGDTVQHFSYNDKWTSVTGFVKYPDSVYLQVRNKEYIRAVEVVEYKRFLGFLWKTRRVKSRDIKIMSDNPNTEIIDASYVRIAD